MYGGSIGTFKNTGTITTNGANGIYIHGGTIKSLDNSGIISSAQTGIIFEKLNWTVAKIETLNNTGSIIGQNKHGLYITGSTDSLHTLNNSGLIYGGQAGIYVSGEWGVVGKMSTINNQGSIIGGQHGIHLVAFNGHLGSTIENITSKGIILGKSGSGVHLDTSSQHIKDYIKLDGSNALIAGGTAGIHNKGTIGVNNNGKSVNNGNVIDLQNGATIAALTFSEDGNSYTYNQEGTAILNEGNIQGNINLDKESKIIGALHNKNTIGGNISLNDKSYITSINNEKTIQGSIDLKNKSHIDSIINSGTIEKGINLNQSTIGSIANSGSIGNGGIKLDDSTIGSITNNEGAKTDLDLKNNSIVGTITNNGDMEISRDETSSIGTFANNGNLKNTFENKDTLGTLENTKGAILEKGLNNDNGSIGLINNAGTIASITNTFNDKTKDAKENKGYIGVITNTGTIGKEASPLATQDITYGINNSGTIEKLINSSGDLTDPNAGKDIHIFGGINNSGYINIENTGNIHGGITNSGTLVVNNGHIHPATADHEATWHSGYIGKNNNGYQLENNTGGKISIDGWYFDELEYTQSNEQRLENSIIIGGN
ncbi:hypothetical protein L8T90_03170, partial [Campylobacter sp. RKI_CA19_01121]|uniref:hypothetical protein n=1 Tax=Campylobacter sp. RKI_CA19_01121 TaxID=2911626 RepID=UPI0021E75E08